ncbi:putative Trafficking protein particle complex subunit 13 [Hypsibius exemplaris]|uniref:Trafficking protein particle complex subunit 13 n=1 Tax=Hypsibius exemplaris TaxID=2072580 RepID=A0A1W0X1Z5_HYPEX|nr:putative Trafficking protein particle complex subunit 13 [Hypsibius exemplaris]
MDGVTIGIAAQPASNGKEDNQLLNMKVLRLLKPSFLSSDAALGQVEECFLTQPEEQDGYGDGSLTSYSPKKDKDNTLLLTDELVLPLAFGTMFLGQTLYCYACISNTSNVTVKDITVRLEFQIQAAAASRSEMVLNEGKQFSLEPQQTFDFVINREIRDLGSHMMIASITHANPQNAIDRLNIKKCFRYTVSKPMDFKNKFVSLPGGYFGELNIQNLTNTTIVLDSVKMITSPEYDSEVLNTHEHLSPEEQLDFRDYLGPSDSRQFVFRIPLKDRTRTADNLKSNVSPGRVEILWRTRMGDVGKVTTSPLTRAVPDARDVFVTLSQRPARVQLHKVFRVTVTVFSLCNRVLDFTIKLVDNPLERSFLWCGVSGRKVGIIQPGGMLDFTLFVVPCSLGLHLFPRFCLIDKHSGQRYDSEDLAEIFVE